MGRARWPSHSHHREDRRRPQPNRDRDPVTGQRVKTIRRGGGQGGIFLADLTADDARRLCGTLDGILDSGIPKQEVQRSLVIDPMSGKPQESVRTVVGRKTIVHEGRSIDTIVVESALIDGPTIRRMTLYFGASGRMLRAEGDGMVELIRLADADEG